MNEKSLNPELELLTFESFCDFLLEEERFWPEPEEFDLLSASLSLSKVVLAYRLKKAGFAPPTHRAKEQVFRGFTSNSHDRYTAVPTYATRSDGQVDGFAGSQQSGLLSQHLI